MKSIPTTVGIFVLIATLAISINVQADDSKKDTKSDKPSATLRLSMDKSFVEGSWPKVAITIKNTGAKKITLVKPGDGSESGWRTPIIGWSIVSADSMKPHPKTPPIYTGGRCGLMNPLKADEVFELKPGKSIQIKDWISFHTPLKPGKYRAVIYYTNDPDLNWQGASSHEEDAMQRVKKSTRISLVSKEIKFEVTEK